MAQRDTAAAAANTAEWLAAWSEFASAVLTVAAIVVGALAWRASRRVLQIELDREEARRQGEETRQAEQVSAWLGPTDWRPFDEEEGLGAHERRLFVRNTSVGPVYGVVAVLWLAGNEVRRFELGVLGPDTTNEELLLDEDPELYGFTPGDESVIPGKLPDLSVSLEFGDTAGHSWARDAKGRLQRM